MGALRIDHLWALLCSLDRFMLLLLVGAIAFSIALIVLLWTRWGHSRSLEKCVLFSFLAHALLTGYAATVQIASFHAAPREQFVRIALVNGPPGAQHGQADGTAGTLYSGSAAGFAAAKNPPLSAIAADKDRAAVKKVVNLSAPKKSPPMKTVSKPQTARPATPAGTQKAMKQLAAAAGTMYPWSMASGWQMAEAAGKYLQDFSTAHAAELHRVVATLTSAPPAPPVAHVPAVPPAPVTEVKTSTTAVNPDATGDANMAAEASVVAGANSIPETYKLRVTGDHIGAALAGGGSQQTEAAVQAALKWLAGHQSEDGRWEARRNEAGRETTPDGRSRPNAGADADTGMTGLALLAMLGTAIRTFAALIRNMSAAA